MDLVRDILDEQMVDKDGRNMGKADGIVLELRDDEPPRVVAVEVGPVVSASRIHPALGRLVRSITRRLGIGAAEPTRIPIDRIGKEDVNLKADIDAELTPAYAWERWLRSHVIGRIPGSGI